MEGTGINGVDVSRLEDTIEAIQAQPELADFEFRAHTSWKGGSRNETMFADYHGAGGELGLDGRFYLERADEPEVLLGEDSAPNPLEHLLAALSSCLTTSLVYHAATRGIVVDDVRAELRGDVDLRGFLGLSPEVRPGYSHIDVTLRVESDASNDELLACARMSPVYDVVSHGTDVELHVEKIGHPNTARNDQPSP